MVRRSGVGIEEVARWTNLCAAYWRASLGKRRQAEVRGFEMRWERELTRIALQLRAGRYRFSPLRMFEIRDPKRRVIHAPVFVDRVVHHALVAVVGPVLDRALVFDTYACRHGKGTHAAVLRAQHHARRHDWFAKIDVRDYFGSIDHATLLRLLKRRFKEPGMLGLFERVLASHSNSRDIERRGLPIGALTSQHFANYYLAGLDRFVLETLGVGGMVRYMDDLAWWGDDRRELSEQLALVREFAERELGLRIHRTQVQRAIAGMSFCGFRVLRSGLRLTRRRMKRYRRARRMWESAFELGCIDSPRLQSGYASALAITRGPGCGPSAGRGFRVSELRRHGAVEC